MIDWNGDKPPRYYRTVILYYCGHAYHGDGTPLPVTAARYAMSVVESWHNCPDCHAMYVPEPPSSARYQGIPHPMAHVERAKKRPMEPTP